MVYIKNMTLRRTSKEAQIAEEKDFKINGSSIIVNWRNVRITSPENPYDSLLRKAQIKQIIKKKIDLGTTTSGIV